MWAYAHGIDDRQVEPPKSRKSVGAECNWGIRFQRDADAVAFMDNLAGELSTRMKGLSHTHALQQVLSNSDHLVVLTLFQQYSPSSSNHLLAEPPFLATVSLL